MNIFKKKPKYRQFCNINFFYSLQDQRTRQQVGVIYIGNVYQLKSYNIIDDEMEFRDFQRIGELHK